MKRTIRLNERELTTLVRRAINEMEDNSETAMSVVEKFLQSRGGGLGARNNDEIEKDLQELEYAIRIEKNGIRDSDNSDGYSMKSSEVPKYGGPEDPMRDQVYERYFRNKRRY